VTADLASDTAEHFNGESCRSEPGKAQLAPRRDIGSATSEPGRLPELRLTE
jgi:hypothetical protein